MSTPKNFKVPVGEDTQGDLALTARKIGGPDYTPNAYSALWLENVKRIPAEKVWKALDAIRPFQRPI